MVRMKDIAARLRLSQTTVSHVLTGKHEHYRISPATVDRVRKMAQELGYRSSALARAFRDRRSYSVTLAVEDLTNPFWTGVAIGAEKEAEAQGYILVVSNTGGNAERERRAVQMLQERRVDGLIVSPVTVTDQALLELRRDGLPFVQIDRSIKGEDVPCVRTDHAAGSALAVDHLVKRGRKEIAYIGGPTEIQTFEVRLEGFRKALARHGLKPAAVRLIPAQPMDAHKAVKELLAAKPRPTALYTGNIWITLGALRAVRDAGLLIPTDLEIVGFDDIAVADLFPYPVSTVWQDVEAIGRESFRLLQKVMKGQKVPREVLIPPRLIVR
ncbi:MAG TPA: LacI family DNA-binding transcriptional regulator [Planctomycetota bacterium]|nr:LacI family DNA-binding transcriptional regulator [Planctomycetota bacterium]